MSDSPTKSFAATVLTFRDIVLLRRGPEDLPASWALLLLTIAGQVVVALLIGAVLPPLPAKAATPDHSLAMLLIDLLVMLLWGWGILRMAEKPERYLQMMTAIFGCQLVLQPLVAPAAWAVGFYGTESPWSLPAAVLGVWALVVLARVLRAATEWAMFSCVFLVFGQVVLTYLVAIAVFPDFLKPP
ncbi:MAG: hypothetical protein ABIQ86_16725 [Steroidobacteraceae bacterium]